MTKTQLAEGLRGRLEEKCRSGELDHVLPGGRDLFIRNLRGISDGVIVGAYVNCIDCTGEGISIQQALRLARHCETVDDWIRGVTAWENFFNQHHEAS